VEIVALEFVLSLIVNTTFWNFVGSQSLGNSSTAKLALTYLGIPIGATILLYSIQVRRRRVRNKNRPNVHFPGSPEILKEGITVSMYGVEWYAVIGYAIFANQELVGAVSGPFCPKDSCLLVENYKPNWIGSEAASWRCATCGTYYPRPKDKLGWEPHDVQNYAMKVYRDRRAREAPNP
jgi:hypothetical protein